MKLTNPTDMTDSQLVAGKQAMSHQFWMTILKAGVPFLFFVAVLSGTLKLPIDADQMPIIAIILHLVTVGGVVLSAIGGVVFPVLFLKVERELTAEMTLRAGVITNE